MRARRRFLLFVLVGMGLAAPTDAAAAPATVIDTASTPDGTQLVMRMNGGNATLVRPHGDGELEIDETGNFEVSVTSQAASRCRIDPESDSRAFCRRTGLLTASATRKPLRFEIGPDGGRVLASESPFPIEVIGGPSGDAVTGSYFDDIIRLGGGNDAVAGYPGADVIDLGVGSDQTRAGDGDDQIDGGDGADWLQGDAGRDLIVGGAGEDLLMAEPNYGDTESSHDLYNEYDRETGDVTEVVLVDRPARCGEGDDTVVRRSAELDPVDGSCERSLWGPSGAPLTIQGTLTVGSELKAARLPVGVDASFRSYLWLSCVAIDSTSLSHDCKPRSTCSSMRLGSADAGKQIMLMARNVYTLAGGQYKVQPADERVWTWRVGESDQPLGPNDFSRIAGTSNWIFMDGVGQQDRTGGRLSDRLDGETCADDAPAPLPSAGSIDTPATGELAATPTPTPTVPLQTDGAVPGATPPPSSGSAAPTRSRDVARQLVAALRKTTTRSLLRRGRLIVRTSPAPGTVLRVRVQVGGRWVNVGIGRVSAAGVTVKIGSVGRARLQRARGKTVRLQVIARAPSEAGVAVVVKVRR